MAVIGINYSGVLETLKYESVYISNNGENILFNTGDFIKDWYSAIKYFAHNVDSEFMTHSSCVNHFFFDGAEYDSAYLIEENNKFELMYGDEYHMKGIEFFVEKNTQPTWENFKKIYGNLVEN